MDVQDGSHRRDCLSVWLMPEAELNGSILTVFGTKAS